MKRKFFLVALLQMVVLFTAVGCGQPQLVPIPGPQGIPGAKGEQGIQGPKGDKGDSVSLSVIHVVVRRPVERDSFSATPSTDQYFNLPWIQQNDRVFTYGAGFVQGEYINFQLVDHNNKVFTLDSKKVDSPGGVFYWESTANWQNIPWSSTTGSIGIIKASGDKGSNAIALVVIAETN